MKYSKLKAIVIGSSGYLGSNLCAYLHLNNIEVQHYDRKSSINFLSKTDLTQIEFNKADLVFIMIGKTGTADGFTEYNDYISSNQLVLMNILNQCLEQNFTGKIVYPSTRLVYKGVQKTPLKEDDIKETKTVYAASKLFAENALFAWNNMYGIRYIIFRICVPYGHLLKGVYSYGTMGFLIRQAKENKKITLFGDGDIYRTFTNVEDICKIMVDASLLSKSDNQIYNIGSNDNLSLKDVANMVGKKYNVGIEYVPWLENYKKLESGDTMFDDSKLKNLMEVNYKNSLSQYFETL